VLCVSTIRETQCQQAETVARLTHALPRVSLLRKKLHSRQASMTVRVRLGLWAPKR
jgi:hypothetical protein